MTWYLFLKIFIYFIFYIIFIQGYSHTNSSEFKECSCESDYNIPMTEKSLQIKIESIPSVDGHTISIVDLNAIFFSIFRMVNVYNKLHRAMNMLEYFTCSEWNWSHNNLDLLKAAMTPEDQRVRSLDFF